MTASHAFKLIGGWSAAITVVLSLSYWSEWPKYRFEQEIKEAVHSLPGARVIAHAKERGFSFSRYVVLASDNDVDSRSPRSSHAWPLLYNDGNLR